MPSGWHSWLSVKRKRAKGLERNLSSLSLLSSSAHTFFSLRLPSGRVTRRPPVAGVGLATLAGWVLFVAALHSTQVQEFAIWIGTESSAVAPAQLLAPKRCDPIVGPVIRLCSLRACHPCPFLSCGAVLIQIRSTLAALALISSYSQKALDKYHHPKY